jgi:putative SOS response-associated peptidase YedK
MCGRFTLTTSAKIIADFFKLSEVPDIEPRYNIAPSQSVATVTFNPEKIQRQFQFMRWGLIPSWAKDMKIASHTINARSETVAEKPAFRSAIKRRRCLIVADGFYEWQQGKKKQPYYFQMANSEPFALAGLWENWRSPEAESILSCSIITTAANETVLPIHHRMPVILPESDWEQWLDPSIDNSQQVLPLLKPYASAAMKVNAVSAIVNSATREGPECIQIIE